MHRRIVAYDLAIVVWTVLWVVVAVLVYRDVRGVAELSEPVIRAGIALEETAEGIASIDALPFVGDIANLPEIERRVREAGISARVSAREQRESVRRLAWLLGISIALAPTMPLIALYVPVRRDWRRRA